VSPFISEVDPENAEEIQGVSHEQDSSDANGTEYNTAPRTIQEQIAYHARKLNTGELSTGHFHNSPFYADYEYLKAFILYITRNADPNYRKKYPLI